ncbi:hypothetical protein [Frankia sp. QA3]|uniref:hypothetical protein n=1 Tax=Frankia sp. QA3 TaxID=710111 RepID=UPI000269BBF4|nr:hypothetical protein [Frankia sp. QA3]EIV92643.1 hypothetical protein FraQA3DRAFT_2236 [Frankia sp. QA3]
MGFLELRGGAADVRAHAASLTEASVSLQAALDAVAGTIDSAERAAPWGHDEYGEQFAGTYYRAGAGSGPPPADAARDLLGDLPGLLARIADGASLAMVDIEAADGRSEAVIRSLAP